MKKTEKIVLGVSALLFICDQIIKALVAWNKPQLDLWLFQIHFVTNTGASFGSFQGNNLAFIFISFMVIGAVLLWYNKIPQYLRKYLIIAIGGVCSNLVDRIARGFVVDYIDFRWWPVFNIADSMIVVAAIIMAALILKEDYFDKNKKK